MNTSERYNQVSDNSVRANDWDMSGVEFAGDKKSSTKKLQKLLERTQFVDLRKGSETFNNFLAEVPVEQKKNYLKHLNQILREASVPERGFHQGRMFADSLVSPDDETKEAVFDKCLEALPKIESDRYRAAMMFYEINFLHLFPDANGRTSRATFEILNNPDFDFAENSKYFAHNDNKSQLDNGGRNASEFLEKNHLLHAKQFGQLVSYAFFEKLTQAGEFGESKKIEKLYNDYYKQMNLPPHRRQNLVYVFGMTADLDSKLPIQNPVLRSLSKDQKKEFGHAIKDQNALVSLSGLAMMKFYQDSGRLEQFLDQTERLSMSDSMTTRYFININPEETEDYGNCVCQDWMEEDFLEYTEIAKRLKRQYLETMLDVFQNPDQYDFNGQRIADLAFSGGPER